MDFFSVDYLKGLVHAYLVPFGINLLLAAIVFLVGRMVARFIVKFADGVMTRANVDLSLKKFLGDLLYAVLLLVVVIATLGRLGVETTAAVAVLGAAGLAIGFALQGSLANFAAGVMIILYKPYRVGEVVNVAGHIGTVQAIHIFNTIMLSADSRTIIIPNGQITSGTIENLSAAGIRRVDMTIGIGYGDDMKQAKEVMMAVLEADDRVLKDPPPEVAVAELGDSSVNLVVRPWCTAGDYWAVKFDMTERIKNALDANGISIPFPQRDVHLHQQKAA
jgi:small conductance mechanosensitive channel